MKHCVPALWVLLVSALATAAFAETGVSEKEIVIGSCSALSGKDAYIGHQTVIGAQAYLNTVNAQGGVFGREIKLLAYDHEYNPEKAILCFNRLIEEGIFASAFATGTPTLAKMAPMAESNKIPLVGLYSGAEFLSDPVQRYVFNLKPSYQDEVIEAVERLWTELGMRKIAVIYQGDALGSSVLHGVKQGLARFHAEPAVISSFDRSNFNADQAISTVRGTRLDAVFVGGAYAPSAAIVKRARQISWRPLIVGFSGTGSEGFIKEAGPMANGMVLTAVIPPVTRTDLPAVSKYLHALRKYFPKEEPNVVSFEAYLDAVILVEGLHRAGKDLTREGFVDAVDSIHDWDIGLGSDDKINYSPQNHKGLKKIFFEVIRHDRLTTVSSWKGLQ